MSKRTAAVLISWVPSLGAVPLAAWLGQVTVGTPWWLTVALGPFIAGPIGLFWYRDARTRHPFFREAA